MRCSDLSKVRRHAQIRASSGCCGGLGAMLSLHTGWNSSPWWWKRPSPHSLTLAPLKPDSLVPACVLRSLGATPRVRALFGEAHMLQGFLQDFVGGAKGILVILGIA